jgi:hypothetical protein
MTAPGNPKKLVGMSFAVQSGVKTEQIDVLKYLVVEEREKA